MRRKLVTVILAAAMSVSLLAGCGTKAEPVVSESVEGTEATSESTEAECEHEWVDATCQEPKHCSKCGKTEGTALDHEWAEVTFAAPKTCTLCGETEGERKQSYFEEHGVDVPDAPVDCTVDAIIYNWDNPQEYQKVVDAVWEQTDCYTEPAEEEGYQLVHLELIRTVPLDYDVQQDVWYDATLWFAGVYDWYTGRKFPARDIEGNDDFEYAATLEIDGASYDVSYTMDVQWADVDDWTYDETGNGIKHFRATFNYVFKVPEGYDGLVFAAIPKREYREMDTETVKGVEEAEYAFLDETNEDYVEGCKYFRINRSEDSAIMTGANAASGAVSGDTSDGAVIDDSREQGSIGESGKPYYKVGFSPKDFTIGGLSVFDGKTAKDFCEAVDVPLQEELPLDGEAWYKWYGEELNTANFRLRATGGDFGFVNYTDNDGKAEMYLSSMEGYTIAGADFIQSPIVPGETTFAEAVDALGIRDVITAMGMQGDAFKDAKLDFESQFSEETHCSVSWGDSHSINMWWTDRDGKQVSLYFSGEDDVVDSLSISRDN